MGEFGGSAPYFEAETTSLCEFSNSRSCGIRVPSSALLRMPYGEHHERPAGQQGVHLSVAQLTTDVRPVKLESDFTNCSFYPI